MKRTCFFAILLILLNGSIFSAYGIEAKKDKKKTDSKKEIYLQLYSVREDIKTTYQATIDSIAKMGYTGIEAAGYEDGKFYGMSPVDFKKSIEKANMSVLSSHAGYSLANPDTKNTDWNKTWAWWDTAIQAHKAAGMKYLVLPWIPTPSTLCDLQTYCDYFNQIGAKCNAAGIRFGYHNHSFEFKEVEGQIIYDYMLKNTDPDKVFFQMDVYWVTEGGRNPIEYFNAYPNRFELLHIKDETELGRSGNIHFKNIFNHIDKSGVKYLIVEVEKYTGKPLDAIKESYHYLNNADFVKDSYSK